ncbi:glycosyltransferase involved in cell wall biosynthesis [Pseudarthrobacter siccitolerans]|uniref:Glycosyltransferase involved in cell wall biosynthesis n=1 Tax=Pseudarthrobacter siccitolerans TaxID=861266 RepID=A0ABU0PJ69_9MICC|nr:glycosyltransferase [Pseudarthrobacter siccitolerans]MDQ0674008.1 glycosyltransferase involved in cell wall biosynthesis [Pseudarthrobacter siccitolerans]
MRVLVAFHDESMGGTSRSALAFAETWKDAGAHVKLYCPSSPHSARLRQLWQMGVEVTNDLSDIGLFTPDLLHIHHGAPSGATTTWVSRLLSYCEDFAPAVLTHDIFGQGLGRTIEKGLRSQGTRSHVVGLLGDWLATQHSAQYGSLSHVRRIIPNPQDFSFFRRPTSTERLDARAARQILPNEKVILRIGSPIAEKWTLAGYLKLAECVANTPNYRLRLIGAPRKLVDALPALPRIEVLQTIADDEVLRAEYWAADVFMHWADRGESFGNVILEALGCGLPVAYRSREFRDNTPWEFQSLSGFSYASNTDHWLTMARRLGRDSFTVSAADATGLEKYGQEQLRSRLSYIVSEVDAVGNRLDAGAIVKILQQGFREPVGLPKTHRWRVALRHNPVAASAKFLKHRFRL